MKTFVCDEKKTIFLCIRFASKTIRQVRNEISSSKKINFSTFDRLLFPFIPSHTILLEPGRVIRYCCCCCCCCCCWWMLVSKSLPLIPKFSIVNVTFRCCREYTLGMPMNDVTLFCTFLIPPHIKRLWRHLWTNPKKYFTIVRGLCDDRRSVTDQTSWMGIKNIEIWRNLWTTVYPEI